MTLRTSYRIPEQNLSKLKNRLATLNRRADKLGTEPIILTITGHEDEINRDKAINQVQRFYLAELEGETPMIGGWHFAATIMHEEAGNIVRAIPGETIPVEFRTGEARCDHCRTARWRKDTYIVRSTDDEFKQVGSGCLRDFTGANSPEKAAAYAELILQMDEMFSDPYDEFAQPASAGEYRFPTEIVLEWTIAIIRKWGWVSRSKSDEFTRATAGWVLDALYEGKKFSDNHDITPTTEHKEQAKEMLIWGREFLTDEKTFPNDYLWNLRIAISEESLRERNVGLAASLVSLYWRETEAERQRAEKRESNWIGEIKERRDFYRLMLNQIITTEGYFGTTWIHKFTDQEGNELVWFASSECLDEGETFSGKATIKDHNEFRGIKQTVITRAKFAQHCPRCEMTIKSVDYRTGIIEHIDETAAPCEPTGGQDD